MHNTVIAWQSERFSVHDCNMQTAVTVFDLLDYYESCERLNISYNKNLGIRGWQACARFIKKVRKDLCNFCLRWFSVVFFSCTLQVRCSHVIFVTIDFCIFQLIGFLC